MPQRQRVALVFAAGVGVALVVALLIAYFVVRGEVRGQIDDSLKAQAGLIAGGDLRALGEGIPAPSPSAGGPAQYSQVVASDGTIVAGFGGLRLPFDSAARSVAAGQGANALEDVHVDGSSLRMLVFGVGGGAVELA